MSESLFTFVTLTSSSSSRKDNKSKKVDRRSSANIRSQEKNQVPTFSGMENNEYNNNNNNKSSYDAEANAAEQKYSSFYSGNSMDISDILRRTSLTSLTDGKTEDTDGNRKNKGKEREGTSYRTNNKGEQVHIVKKTDTLEGIALLYNVDIMSIKRVNRLWRKEEIFARKELIIPSDSACHSITTVPHKSIEEKELIKEEEEKEKEEEPPVTLLIDLNGEKSSHQASSSLKVRKLRQSEIEELEREEESLFDL